MQPELVLVAACLRRPLDVPAQARISRLSSAPIDWEGVLGWTRRHRVTSLVFEALRQVECRAVPPAILDRLQARARQRIVISLQQIAATSQLTRALAEAGIPALVLKGPALSQIAFGNPSLRDSRDVDLLVDPARVEQVHDVLAACGYQRIKPEGAVPMFLFAAYRYLLHEFVYRSAANGMIVEVKHRLLPTASLLGFDSRELVAHPRLVRVAGCNLPVLPAEEMFLYLCAHGSRHGWFRLKWLADIAALIGRIPGFGLDRIVDRAEALGVKRPLNEAILLSHDMLAIPVPTPLVGEATKDRHALRGVALAQRAIGVYGRGGDPYQELGFAARLACGEYRLRHDWHYRASVLQRQLMHRIYTALRPLLHMAAKAVLVPVTLARPQATQSARSRSLAVALRAPRILWRLVADPPYRSMLWLRWRGPAAGVFQPFYDTAPNRYPVIFRSVQDLLGTDGRHRILSFGCSTGEEVFSLRRSFPNASVKGIDANPGAIAVARRRLHISSDAVLSFEINRSTAGEPSAVYDAIFCMAVLQDGRLRRSGIARCDPFIRFADFAAVIADFDRCLKPGGLLVIRHSNFRLCDAPAGRHFETVLGVPLPPGQKAPLFGPDNARLANAEYPDTVFRKRGASAVAECPLGNGWARD